MKKGGKPATFGIRFANGKFIAEVSSSGTVLTVAALDTSQEKDREKRRGLLKSISDPERAGVERRPAGVRQEEPRPGQAGCSSRASATT